jgi:hypothetical protein
MSLPRSALSPYPPPHTHPSLSTSLSLSLYVSSDACVAYAAVFLVYESNKLDALPPAPFRVQFVLFATLTPASSMPPAFTLLELRARPQPDDVQTLASSHLTVVLTLESNDEGGGSGLAGWERRRFTGGCGGVYRGGGLGNC